ncbi:Uncharacterized protein Fot_00300 [Forsythia ovata]|uniref:Uncharacterized protein n=1 Tax=Forsythia ovata TaxID=205694 RepID=A0ABD1X170_9LAMI
MKVTVQYRSMEIVVIWEIKSGEAMTRIVDKASVHVSLILSEDDPQAAGEGDSKGIIGKTPLTRPGLQNQGQNEHSQHCVSSGDMTMLALQDDSQDMPIGS